MKLSGLRDLKRLLKRALSDRLPPAILRRGKQGFGVPFDRWFRGPLMTFLRDVLAPDRLRRGGFFDDRSVTRLVDEHIAGTRNHDSVLWTILVFELWRSEYLGDAVGVP